MIREIDLSLPDYAEWLRIIFDHPVPTSKDPNEAISQTWFMDEETNVHRKDAVTYVAHVTRLCNDFNHVADQYPLPQLNLGLWLLVLGGWGALGETLADRDVPVEARLECVRSMFHPFADFVASSQVEDLETCFEGWWELVCKGFWHSHLWRLKCDEIYTERERQEEEYLSNRSPERIAWDERYYQILKNFRHGEDLNELLHSHGMSFDDFPDEPINGTDIDITFDELEPTEQRVMDVMLETLVAILNLNEERCEYYALHGLGHLKHPRKPAIVQAFIDRNAADLDEDTRKWLEQCRDGTLM